jgi:hypothetical protein
VTDREELEAARARVAALEQELAELRAKDAPIGGALVKIEQRRRARIAKLMIVGGAVAGLSGVFGHSIYAIVCGLGWIFGGGAVASTLPRSSSDDR